MLFEAQQAENVCTCSHSLITRVFTTDKASATCFSGLNWASKHIQIR